MGLGRVNEQNICIFRRPHLPHGGVRSRAWCCKRRGFSMLIIILRSFVVALVLVVLERRVQVKGRWFGILVLTARRCSEVWGIEKEPVVGGMRFPRFSIKTVALKWR